MRFTQSPDHFILYLCISILIGAILLSLAQDKGDSTSSRMVIWGSKIPYFCYFKAMTGMDCPGCGLVRSFTAMGGLNLKQSYDLNRLGPILFILALLQIPWRGFFILYPRYKGRFKDKVDKGIEVFFVLILVALFANWVFNIYTGQAFRT